MWLCPCTSNAVCATLALYTGVAITTIIEPGMALPTTEDRGGSLMWVGRNPTAVGTGIDCTSTVSGPIVKALRCTSMAARSSAGTPSAVAAGAKIAVHIAVAAVAPTCVATILLAASTLGVGCRNALATRRIGLSGLRVSEGPVTHSYGPHFSEWAAAWATKMARTCPVATIPLKMRTTCRRAREHPTGMIATSGPRVALLHCKCHDEATPRARLALGLNTFA